MHDWIPLQFSLFVYIIQYWELVDGGWTLRKEMHGFWSEDKTKDTAFMLLARWKIRSHLEARGVHIETEVLWTDNCSSQ